MSQQDQQPYPEQPGEYEYDLAHEAGRDAPPTVRRPHPPRPCVTRRPEDEGGDLSYDLAHDLPPSTGR